MPPTSITTTDRDETSSIAEPGTHRGAAKGQSSVKHVEKKKIWIDLDNSPHVPFFLPIIQELRAKGYEVALTARDSYQVRDLLNFHKLECAVIGGHYGKNSALKVGGTILRVLQLLPWVLRERPKVAFSHGSRAQTIASWIFRIQKILALDYEFTTKTWFIRPDWVFIPEVISNPSIAVTDGHILKYPGLKEDVYVPRFQPDKSVLKVLGIKEHEMVVTVRPPAVEAHYHNPESEKLLDATLDHLLQQKDLRVILLPRNDRQAVTLREQRADAIASGKIVIPGQVVDGLSLIWFSDLVISGGGTMNREAAALGVPVYSIFRGKIGGVDRYLAEQGRLILLEKVEDVQSKIALVQRDKSVLPSASNQETLNRILGKVIDILEDRASPAER
jgi:uncharacterized protein